MKEKAAGRDLVPFRPPKCVCDQCEWALASSRSASTSR